MSLTKTVSQNTHKLCQTYETIIFIDQCDGLFPRETILKSYDTSEALALVETMTVKALRLNIIDFSSEDISEDLAQMWLDTHSIAPLHGTDIPLLVRQSIAWQDFCLEHATAIDDITEKDAYAHNPAYLGDVELGIGRRIKPGD